MTPLAVIVFKEKLSSFKWLLINDLALLFENNDRIRDILCMCFKNVSTSKQQNVPKYNVRRETRSNQK